MNRVSRSSTFVAALLVVFAASTHCRGQALPSLPGVHDTLYCGSVSQGGTQTGGAAVTSFGTIHALVVFIDFPDDSEDIMNSTWTVGAPPSYLSDIIDLDTSVHSNKQYNITTYFDRMSFNNLHVVGHPYYKQALHSIAWYKSQPAFQNNIEYWATRHVLEYIDTAAAYNVNYALFDRWKTTAPYTHSNIPDGNVDQVFIMWRRWYMQKDSTALNGGGFVAEGWVPLVGSSFPVEGGTKTLASNHVTNSTGLLYYPSTFDSPIHEFGHYLGLPHEYDGGLWSLMGQRNSNVGYCMNSLEREKMGWITVSDITTDGTTATIPDFAATGTAYRLSVPGSRVKFLIENHQGTEMYDIPDHSVTAPGLYIIRDTDEVYDNGLQLMTADGSWHWNNIDSVVNPWGSNYIPMFKRDTVMRRNGLSDREHLPYTKPYSSALDPTYFLYVWLDERSGDQMHGARKFGDGKDRWITGEMFSPWSNPSSTTNDTATSHIGVEITGTSGSNINVKFYTTHPENGPPSDPQDPRCWGTVDSTDTSDIKVYPRLTWDANIEPDIAGYEIWRRFGPDILNGPWYLIESVGGSATMYVDSTIDDADTNDHGLYEVAYKLRAFDSSNKLSTYSEIRGIYYGYSYVDDGGGGCCIGGGKMVARRADDPNTGEVALWPNRPNPFNSSTEIAYSLTRPGRVIVDVFNATGKRVAVLVDGVEQDKGTYRVTLDGRQLDAGVYLCRVLVNGMAVAEPITLTR